MPVKLDQEVTVEFNLFDAFANFMARIENFEANISQFEKSLVTQKIPNTKRNLFFCYIGDSLLGNLSARSVANIYSGTAPIEDERFQKFCRKFIEIFNALSKDQKIRYASIYNSFLEWRNKIYVREFWNVPDDEFFGDAASVSNQRYPNFQREIFDLLRWDIPFTTDENGNKVLTSEKYSEEFLKSEVAFAGAMETVRKYYQNFRERYSDESRYFMALRRLYEMRKRTMQPNSNLYSYMKDNLQKILSTDEFAIYELKDDKIIRQKIRFASEVVMEEISFDSDENLKVDQQNFNDTMCGFNCSVLYCTDNELTPRRGAVTVNVLHATLRLGLNTTGFDQTDTIIVTASPSSTQWVGHRFIYDRIKGIICGNIVVIRREGVLQETFQVGVAKLDKLDAEVPEFIRSLLLVPSEHNIKPNPFIDLPLSIFEDFDIYSSLRPND